MRLTEQLICGSLVSCYSMEVSLYALIFRIIGNDPFFHMISSAGFFFISATLRIEEECRWVKESLVSFPQPSNRTSHNGVSGSIHNYSELPTIKKY